MFLLPLGHWHQGKVCGLPLSILESFVSIQDEYVVCALDIMCKIVVCFLQSSLLMCWVALVQLLDIHVDKKDCILSILEIKPKY